MRQSLLPGDPADINDDRPGWVDAQPCEDLGVGSGREQLRVDAVVDHVHALRVDLGIRREHVRAHSLRDGDDRVRGEHHRSLRP